MEGRNSGSNQTHCCHHHNGHRREIFLPCLIEAFREKGTFLIRLLRRGSTARRLARFLLKLALAVEGLLAARFVVVPLTPVGGPGPGPGPSPPPIIRVTTLPGPGEAGLVGHHGLLQDIVALCGGL